MCSKYRIKLSFIVTMVMVVMGTKYHGHTYYYQQLLCCCCEHIAMAMVVVGHICTRFYTHCLRLFVTWLVNAYNCMSNLHFHSVYSYRSTCLPIVMYCLRLFVTCKPCCLHYDQSLVVMDTNTPSKLLWVSNEKKKMKNFAHSSTMVGMGPIPILSTTVLKMTQ